MVCYDNDNVREMSILEVVGGWRQRKLNIGFSIHDTNCTQCERSDGSTQNQLYKYWYL
jgi:hypothetical protein